MNILNITDNLVFVFTGPSGAGKTTYSHMLIEKMGMKCGHNVTVTTRRPRTEDVNSEYFKFVSKDKFQYYKDTNKFFCCTEFCGNQYGLLKEDLYNVLNKEKNLILDSIMPIERLKKLSTNVVIIYLLTDSNKELKRRIIKRNPTMDSKERERRFSNMISQHRIVRFTDYIINTSGKRTKEKVFDDVLELYSCTKASLDNKKILFPKNLYKYSTSEYLKYNALPND